MLGSGLWAATILDRILAAVGSPFGIDTSGMSSLAAAAAVAFAIYSWYSKIKPKPGPTPTPEPQPSPTPQPLPSPTPSPSRSRSILASCCKFCCPSSRRCLTDC